MIFGVSLFDLCKSLIKKANGRKVNHPIVELSSNVRCSVHGIFSSIPFHSDELVFCVDERDLGV